MATNYSSLNQIPDLIQLSIATVGLYLYAISSAGLGNLKAQVLLKKTCFSNSQQEQGSLRKRTGIVGECKQSIISIDPLLPGVLVALPDHDFAGAVDWHGEHAISILSPTRLDSNSTHQFWHRCKTLCLGLRLLLGPR